MKILKVLGLLLAAAGVASFLIVVSGAADAWLADNWTCASGHGIREERACNPWEAKWSAIVLSGTAVLLGLLAVAIPALRRMDSDSGDGQMKVGATIDLSRIRRVR